MAYTYILILALFFVSPSLCDQTKITKPTNSNNIIYVTQDGDNTTGDGSFESPYASLAKAIDTANNIASASEPITILIAPGTYTEDNSAGPLSIQAEGVFIIGDSPSTVILIPNTPENDFLEITQTIYMSNATLISAEPLATGILFINGELSTINNLKIINFDTGIECTGTTSGYVCESCIFNSNTTEFIANDTIVEIQTNNTTDVERGSYLNKPHNHNNCTNNICENNTCEKKMLSWSKRQTR